MHGAFDLDTIAGWCSGADYWGWRWTSSNAQLDFDSVDFVWQQQHRRSIVCSQQWCSGMCIAAVAPQQQQQYQPWIFANAIAWWLMAFGVTLIWINDILEHAYRLSSRTSIMHVWNGIYSMVATTTTLHQRYISECFSSIVCVFSSLGTCSGINAKLLLFYYMISLHI